MSSHVRGTQWHMVICTAVALALASSTLGVTVKLRSGKQVVGSVLDKNDTNIVLKTTVAGTTVVDRATAGTNASVATRIVTIAWREVTTETLKALHPDLYARLKAKADEAAAKKAEAAKALEETMRAEGKVLVGGKWLPQAEVQAMMLRRIRIKAASRQVTKEVDRDTSANSSWKEVNLQCWGEVKVMLAGLDPKATHTLKVSGTHYRTGSSSSGSDRSPTFELEKTLTGATECTEVIKTPEYSISKTSYHGYYSGSHKYEYGLKSDGFDISISIDDVLVFEQKKGEAPKFYHVSSL